MKHYYYIFLLIIVSSCNKSTEVLKFENDFNEKINKIESLVEYNSEIDSEQVAALTYLYVLTNHAASCSESKRSYDSFGVVTYSKKQFEKDKEKWLEWLTRNSNKYSSKNYDSIYNVIVKLAKPENINYKDYYIKKNE